MLTIEFTKLMFEIKDGSLKNIGPTNKTARTKLFDVTDVEIREFGDKRVKLVFADDEGNEVQISLFPDEAEHVSRGIESLKSGPVFDQ